MVTNQNLIIEGDNLSVMEALYAGKIATDKNIDFMLWDPPYNTGNTHFMYNDNRKSTWLSFMEVRLELAKKLLKETGVIAVHISYHELFRLGLLMDEVFGEDNRLGIINWECTYGPKNNKKRVPSTTDYVLIYAKNKDSVFRGVISRTQSMKDKYKNHDNDPRGPWIKDNLTVGMNSSMRPNQAYDLVDPKTGKIYPFNPNRVWAFIPSTMKKMIKEGRIIFPKDTSQRPMQKRFQSELKSDGRTIGTYWESEEILDSDEVLSLAFPHELSDHNGTAKKLIRAILGNKCTFDTPKPLKLTERLIEMFCPKDGIILDAFGGSATTAHAILKLNAEQNLQRRFILIEIERNFIESITIERIRRVINGQWESPRKDMPATGGEFVYLKI